MKINSEKEGLKYLHQKCTCLRCGREVERIELFSGDLCLPCYEREYEGMREKAKKPNFIRTINL